MNREGGRERERMMGEKKKRILGEKGRTRKSKQRNRKGNYQKHGQMKKMSEKYIKATGCFRDIRV